MRLLVLIGLMLAWQVAGAVTYDVRAIHICKNATLCGDDEKVLGKFERVNKRFAPIGITFRPTVERLYNSVYVDITDYNSPGVDDLLAMAQATPTKITYFVIEGGNFICWSDLPQKVGAGGLRAYSLFCYTQVTGSVYAHELGHFMCLPHPHSFQDPITHGTPNHNGDGLAGTPADPGIHESTLVNSGGADDGAGRDWCTSTDLDNSYTDIVFEGTNYPGMAKERGCTVACERSNSSGTTPLAFSPLPENGMSYYDGCEGPWTFDGVRHEYFVQDQATRVAQCIADEPERQLLVDVCAGDGDDDGDGLCNSDDACPNRPALVGMDKDDDNDGIVDGCDVCPGFAGNGTDTDHDGFCDAIDEDDDNDTCRDSQDEHPLEDMLKVGYQIGDRPACTGPIYLWEGTPGPNGIAICHDYPHHPHDIDGDGIKNDVDFCPLEAGLGCIQTASCPLPPPHWWLTCALGGCNELELVVVSVSNPGVVLARSAFEISNGVLYARAAQGQTLLETARTFGGALPPGQVLIPALRAKAQTAVLKEAPARLRFEIRRRDGSVVERVAEADVRNIRVGPLVRGDVLALQTDNSGGSVNVGVSWGVGIAPGALLADRDRDQIPDAHDNCIEASNRDQYDGDGDGYGNRCDPDLDNDGRVGSSDATRMHAAIGGEGETPMIGEDSNGHDVLQLPRVPVEFVAGADIDGDGRVTAEDERLWRGLRLGPSAVRK